MKKILIYLICSFIGLTITCYAGSVPQLINYQGQIKTPENSLPFTGTKKFEFNIYDAASNGNKIFGPQIFNNVPVIQGTYNVILGTTDSVGRSIADAFGDQQRFLGVTIDDGNEVEPRQQVLSSPFAFHAGVSNFSDRSGYASHSGHAITANQADTALNGIPSGGIIMWSGSAYNIPFGWALCNGTNGTPDLQNRFVVGKGSQFSGIGGSSTQTVHFRLKPHSHSVKIKAEKTGVGKGSWAQYGLAGISMTDRDYEVEMTSAEQFVNISNEGDSDYSSSENISVIPPYYALCFIIKL
ncbi:MAG: tail fiber protein [Candidatus Magnetomorum sp.]|nr:tail fiber protein [Candidatus Magnetomorum sp.]